MSIENVFRSVFVEIFNAFQNYAKEKVIPEMIESFAENGVEVDFETFDQFFEDIKTYPEIAKYIDVKKSTITVSKSKPKTETKTKRS